MTYSPEASQFDLLHAMTTNTCDSFLGSVQSLHNGYQAEHGHKILKSLTQLQKTIENIRETYGIRNHNAYRVQPRSELQLEIRDLRNQLEMQKFDLEGAKATIKERDDEIEERQNEINEYRDLITKFEATVENLRKNLASKYQETKDFDLAAQEYKHLSKVKAKERLMWSQQIPLTDGSAHCAQMAESAELDYEFKYGKMLVENRKYHDAEVTFVNILERRERHYNDHHVRLWQTREVQSELCRVLRLQMTKEGFVKAEELYFKAGFLESLNSQNDADRTWAVQNAFNTACVRVERGHYVNAIKQLEYVWPYRHHASAEYIQEMDSRVVWLLESMEERGQGASAQSALEAICEGDGTLSPKLLRALAAVGLRLRDEGNNRRAIKYLQIAWVKTSTTEQSKELLKLGWAYSLSLCDDGHGVRAESVLKRLLQLSKTKTTPNEIQVMALLAHTQLAAGNFQTAKQTAQAVYDQYRTSTILQSRRYHQADTLIRAIAREEFYNGKWTSAEKIWKTVFENARDLPIDSSSSANKDQIKNHAATGLELAKRWNLWRKDRGKSALPKVNTIKQQAQELQKRTV